MKAQFVYLVLGCTAALFLSNSSRAADFKRGSAYQCQVSEVTGTFGSESPPQVGDEIFLDLEGMKEFEGPDLRFSRPSDDQRRISIPVPGAFHEIPIVVFKRFRSKKDNHVLELQLISQDWNQGRIWIFSSGYPNNSRNERNESRSDLYLNCSNLEMS